MKLPMEEAALEHFRVGRFLLPLLEPAKHVFFGFEGEQNAEQLAEAYETCLAELGIKDGIHHSVWLTQKMMFVVVRESPCVWEKDLGVTICFNSLGYTGNLAVRNKACFDYLSNVGPLSVLRTMAAQKQL